MIARKATTFFTHYTSNNLHNSEDGIWDDIIHEVVHLPISNLASTHTVEERNKLYNNVIHISSTCLHFIYSTEDVVISIVFALLLIYRDDPSH